MKSEELTPTMIAADLVVKMKSPFCDDPTATRWIEHSLMDAIREAKKEEHDRIEKILGTADRKTMLQMWETAKWKWGKRK